MESREIKLRATINKSIRRLSFLLLTSTIFSSKIAFGSEKSHAAFRVENVGKNEHAGNLASAILPSTNELYTDLLLIVGIVMTLLALALIQHKKGSSYE